MDKNKIMFYGVIMLLVVLAGAGSYLAFTSVDNKDKNNNTNYNNNSDSNSNDKEAEIINRSIVENDYIDSYE